MMIDVWGRLKESIRIEELDIEIRNLTIEDELYIDDVKRDIADNFKTDADFLKYLEDKDILIDKENALETFLSGLILIELIPDDEIFFRSSLNRINNGMPFLFCEDFMEYKILLFLQFINNSVFNRLNNELPYINEIYPGELTVFNRTFRFFDDIGPFRYQDKFEEKFANVMKTVFRSINEFLKEDENNAFTLDLIFDAIKSIENTEGTKQSLLPCFSIIERTLVEKSFSRELDKIESFTEGMFKPAGTSGKHYLDDIMTLRSKLIHGEYYQFYDTLRHIHRKYYNSNTWDSSEYTPLNWCLNYVLSDMTIICRNILFRKFVLNNVVFAKKRH